MPPKRKAVSFAVDEKQPKISSPSLTLRRSARHIAKKQKPYSSTSSPSLPTDGLATATASSLEATPVSLSPDNEENSSGRTNSDEKTLPVSDEEEYEAMLQSVPKVVTTKQRARSMMLELLRKYPISKYQVFEVLVTLLGHFTSDMSLRSSI
jgi:hypothetical protein